MAPVEGSFMPKPDVASCVVSRMKDRFPLSEDQERFLDVISRAVFSKRRKTVTNGLLEVVPDRALLIDTLTKAGIDPANRPEDLGVGSFVQMALALWPVHRALSG